LSLRSKEGALAILSYDGFEITMSVCFRKTPRDDIENKPFSAISYLASQCTTLRKSFFKKRTKVLS